MSLNFVLLRLKALEVQHRIRNLSQGADLPHIYSANWNG